MQENFLQQPAFVYRCSDKGNKQRMRRKGLGFEFRVELHADKPRMVWNLNNLRQLAIRRLA